MVADPGKGPATSWTRLRTWGDGQAPSSSAGLPTGQSAKSRLPSACARARSPSACVHCAPTGVARACGVWGATYPGDSGKPTAPARLSDGNGEVERHGVAALPAAADDEDDDEDDDAP